jgi:hypothetical protein
MIRMSPEREPSLARLASTVTALPAALSKSLFLAFSFRKTLGAGPSNNQVSTWPPSLFASTDKLICGFLQSISVSVPVRESLVEVEEGRHVVMRPHCTRRQHDPKGDGSTDSRVHEDAPSLKAGISVLTARMDTVIHPCQANEV